MSTPIKLLEISPIGNTRRFKSQLAHTCDFIIEDGILKCWGWVRGKGVDFHPTNIDYLILTNSNDLLIQQL